MSPHNYHSLGSDKHVFIDWSLVEPGYGVASRGPAPVSWEMPYGVRLAVHRPRIDDEPLVWPDRLWEDSIDYPHVTLFEDEGRFRLYYLCWSLSAGDHPSSSMLAYAESADGITWDKPRIGAVRFNGSTDNNLVFAMSVALDRPVLSPIVFKDAGASPDERYKLAYRGREHGKPCLFGAVSPDGLRWSASEKPLLSNYRCDTQNVICFDPKKGRYVGYFRSWSGYERGVFHGRRTIAYAETEDFRSWPVPGTIVAPDLLDSPDTDIYTNAYTPWHGADAHLMFPAFYQRRRDVAELHMMTSRDGLRWERPSRQPIIPGGEPGSDWEGSIYAGCGLVAIRPGQWSIPILPQPVTHNQRHYPEAMASPAHRGYVCLATWREDGFVSLEAESRGAFATLPLTFSGSRLIVNAWTRFGGEIRLEVADASGETRVSSAVAIAGRGLEDCDPITGDALKHVVTWSGESDLSAWAGRPVRLRVQMRRARLYAIRFA